MIVSAKINAPPPVDECFDTRINGPDKGLINAWLVGIRKRTEEPFLADCAKAGELPSLPFRGGVAKKIKADKIGVLHYVAAWQGLRGEDLQLDTDKEIALTCSSTGVQVTYTLDSKKLFSAYGEDSE